MCSTGVWKKQQRLLKNMGAHKVMLDLLQVSYDKVSLTETSVFDDGKTNSWLRTAKMCFCVSTE